MTDEAAKRLKILIDLDIDGARRIVPAGPKGEPMSDGGLLVGMHKARLHWSAVPRALRIESLEYLRKHGFKDLWGQPLPDTLPQ